MATKEIGSEAVIGDGGATAVRQDYQQRPGSAQPGAMANMEGPGGLLLVESALTVGVTQTVHADRATINDMGDGNVQDVFIRQGAGNDTATVVVPGKDSTGIVRDVTLNGGRGMDEAVLVMDHLAGRVSLSQDGQSLVFSDPYNHVERVTLGDYSILTIEPKANGEQEPRFEVLHFDAAQLVEVLRDAPDQSMRVRDLMGDPGIDARSFD